MMRLIFLSLVLLALVRCASEPSSDVSPDVADATDASQLTPDTPSDAANNLASNETSEQELSGDAPPGAAPESSKKSQPQASPDAMAQNDQAADAAALDGNDANSALPPPPTEAPPAEASEPPPPPPTVEADNNPPPAATSSSPEINNDRPATVTALDFKSNLNGGTVVIRTNRAVEYTTRKNSNTNQFVIELKNTTVPKKFRLPYTTKEFSSPIASINAYQSQSGDRAARIVVQMRGNSQPLVAQDGNIISLAGNGLPGANTAQNTPEVPEQVAQDETPMADVSTDDGQSVSIKGNSASGMGAGGKPLAPRTLSDFLTGNTKFYGRPISLELRDADIHDAFKFIAEESGLNIVLGEDVNGKISLKLRKIPWDQALTVVLQAKQLGYIKQGNILRIATLKTLQSEADSARNLLDAQKLLEPLHVQTFPISYAKADDLEKQAKDFLSTRGKARADLRTNTLVVTDISEILGKIKSLVHRLDTQTPQVLIEAKIVEARETFERLVGVQWGFNGNPSPIGTNNTGGTVNATPSFNSNPIDTGATVVGNLGVQVGTLDIFGDLTASLKLLEIEQLVKVISSPRIVTLNHVKATIQQTTQFPIFAQSTINTPGTVSPATITFQDVRLILDVQPQITKDGAIIMDVNVLREFADPPTQIGGSEARAVNKRQATTQVLVENGDTVVIGGIYQSDVTDASTGTPWLMKIPIIGNLFKEHDIQRQKNELVIFLTPRTLNTEKAFAKEGDAG